MSVRGMVLEMVVVVVVERVMKGVRRRRERKGKESILVCGAGACFVFERVDVKGSPDIFTKRKNSYFDSFDLHMNMIKT